MPDCTPGQSEIFKRDCRADGTWGEGYWVDPDAVLFPGNLAGRLGVSLPMATIERLVWLHGRGVGGWPLPDHAPAAKCAGCGDSMPAPAGEKKG